MIILDHKDLIAAGSFRDCYRITLDHCIKIVRPDIASHFSLVDRALRRDARNPNQMEYNSYQNRLTAGIPLDRYFPRLFGFIETNRGPGILVELIQGSDGQPPVSLETYTRGLAALDGISHARMVEDLTEFARFCTDNLIYAYCDELRNVGYIREGDGYRFIASDLKERRNKEFFPVSSWFPFLLKRKIRRRFTRTRELLINRLSAMP